MYDISTLFKKEMVPTFLSSLTDKIVIKKFLFQDIYFVLFRLTHKKYSTISRRYDLAYVKKYLFICKIKYCFESTYFRNWIRNKDSKIKPSVLKWT